MPVNVQRVRLVSIRHEAPRDMKIESLDLEFYNS